jgi:hypothetical protein
MDKHTFATESRLCDAVILGSLWINMRPVPEKAADYSESALMLEDTLTNAYMKLQLYPGHDDCHLIGMFMVWLSAREGSEEKEFLRQPRHREYMAAQREKIGVKYLAA